MKNRSSVFILITALLSVAYHVYIILSISKGIRNHYIKKSKNFQMLSKIVILVVVIWFVQTATYFEICPLLCLPKSQLIKIYILKG